MAGETSHIFRTVQQAVHIEEVIGDSIALKNAGRELVGLCPFHEDRRPSMYVSPQKQIFHCFVCATGGDVFKFVQLYHKMTPGESLRFLARRANITLPERPRSGGGPARPDEAGREKVASLNEWACGFYEKLLAADAGRTARDYLRQRGLTEETCRQFRLGASPDGWSALADAAGRRGLAAQDLVDSGLARRRSDGGIYDVFRNRAMFPILDATGRTIGFGARLLPGKDPPPAASPAPGSTGDAPREAPKYLNSPETPLFVKKEALYGLYQAKTGILRERTAILVEGYMDVIACHQAGVTNVVATLGTALTPEHARHLRRYAQTVVLIFDSDDAGRRAADRALEIFLREPLDVKIASVPDGKDPCDFCMSHGGDAFKAVIAGATDALTYQWTRLQREFTHAPSLNGQQQSAKALLEFVRNTLAGRQDDLLRRGLLITRLTDLLGLPREQVQAALAAPTGRRDDSGGETAHAVARPATALSGLPLSEHWVIGALLTEPVQYAAVREAFTLELFAADSLRALAEQLLEYLEHAVDLPNCSLAEFIGTLTDKGLVHQAIMAQNMAEQGGNVQQKLIDALRYLQSLRGGPAGDALPDGDVFPGVVATPSADDEAHAADRDVGRDADGDADRDVAGAPDGAGHEAAGSGAGATSREAAVPADTDAFMQQIQAVRQQITEGGRRRILGPARRGR